MVTDPPVRFKHAFVTGATGIVGVPLCIKLSEMGVRVTGYSRSTGDIELPANIDHAQGDILDLVALANAAQGADVIFHVAAAVHGSVSSYSEFERMNVTGTENVIRVAHDIGARLVHVSTVNVEGFRSGTLTDAYAATKSRGEELVVEAVGDGLDAAVVRPAAVFGNVSGRSGLLVDRLLAGSVKVLPGPSRKMSPVWSDDLATALIRVAEIGETGRVYTVAGPTMNTGDFVRLVCASARVRRPVVSIPAWIFAVPLQLAWWGRGVTRWTPPVSVESLLNGSIHDGSAAAVELGFSYTPIAEIFG